MFEVPHAPVANIRKFVSEKVTKDEPAHMRVGGTDTREKGEEADADARLPRVQH